jgi:chitodextrinase
VINSPDVWQSGGNSCDVVNDQVALASGTNGYLGLPTFPNCYVDPPCEVTAGADWAVESCVFYFTDKSVTGSQTEVVAWLWTFGDGQSSNLQNPTHNYLANGTYEVCLKVIATTGDECCVDEYCFEVEVDCDGDPCNIDASFTFDNCERDCEYRFYGTAFNYGLGQIGGWHWDFGDGTTGSGQNPSHTFPGPGSYQVCLTVYVFTSDNECCSVEVCTIIEVDCEPDPKHRAQEQQNPEGEEKDGPGNMIDGQFNTIEAYPNPAQDAMNINFIVEENGPVTMTIIDSKGRVAKEIMNNENRKQGLNHVVVDTQGLNNGVYIVVYRTGNTVKTHRLSVQH